eukprot:TRINITY_DN22297_c0_g1_i1.p1 TRINITY_DN22297_c0_g1~~TRINITY_DN22297_c0_g1_i1.p1  ORF type:complete len:323 (-),score=68.27 TRINITY_DN22297_c0_g1_i1:74-1042(-)
MSQAGAGPRCAAAGCEAIEGLKLCTACRQVRYCSVQCQRADRQRHRSRDGCGTPAATAASVGPKTQAQAVVAAVPAVETHAGPRCLRCRGGIAGAGALYAEIAKRSIFDSDCKHGPYCPRCVGRMNRQTLPFCSCGALVLRFPPAESGEADGAAASGSSAVGSTGTEPSAASRAGACDAARGSAASPAGASGTERPGAGNGAETIAASQRSESAGAKPPGAFGSEAPGSFDAAEAIADVEPLASCSEAPGSDDSAEVVAGSQRSNAAAAERSGAFAWLDAETRSSTAGGGDSDQRQSAAQRWLESAGESAPLVQAVDFEIMD